VLAIELQGLVNLDFDAELTGLSPESKVPELWLPPRVRRSPFSPISKSGQPCVQLGVGARSRRPSRSRPSLGGHTLAPHPPSAICFTSSKRSGFGECPPHSTSERTNSLITPPRISDCEEPSSSDKCRHDGHTTASLEARARCKSYGPSGSHKAIDTSGRRVAGRGASPSFFEVSRGQVGSP
jgi:hypothetical protein